MLKIYLSIIAKYIFFSSTAALVFATRQTNKN